MARFRATIQGQRGEASRLGSTKSGIEAYINGWDVGIRVVGSVNSDTGEDEFTIFKPSGSNGMHHSTLIGTFTTKEGEVKSNLLGHD